MPQEFKSYQDKSLDAKYKILPKEYPEVIAQYKLLKSSRKVAELFGVTKNIILAIVNPDYKERDRQRKIRNKVWLRYYDRKKHTIAIRKVRAKKRKLNHVVIK